jgi:hypothetical protein
LPWKNSDRAGVGAHREITEASFPIREFESVHRIHFDIHGEEIIATVGAVLSDALEIKRRSETFSHETAEYIGNGDDNGVDFPFFDAGF